MKLHLILPGDLVEQVDLYAKRLTKEDPFSGKKNRTDAFKALLVEALKSKGLIK